MERSEKNDLIGVGLAAVGGLMGFWLNLQVVYQALCLLLLADLVFGTLDAVLNLSFNMHAIGAGATRKAMTLLFVTLLAYLSGLTELNIPAGETLSIFYIWRELVSVTRHYVACGGTVPEQIKHLLSDPRGAAT